MSLIGIVLQKAERPAVRAIAVWKEGSGPKHRTCRLMKDVNGVYYMGRMNGT